MNIEKTNLFSHLFLISVHMYLKTYDFYKFFPINSSTNIVWRKKEYFNLRL